MRHITSIASFLAMLQPAPVVVEDKQTTVDKDSTCSRQGIGKQAPSLEACGARDEADERHFATNNALWSPETVIDHGGQQAVNTLDGQEAVNALCAVVEGLDETDAHTLLQTTGGNVQLAVNLYFDRQGAGAASPVQHMSAEKPTSSAVNRKRPSALPVRQTVEGKRPKGQASITAFFTRVNAAEDMVNAALQTSHPSTVTPQSSDTRLQQQQLPLGRLPLPSTAPTASPKQEPLTPVAGVWGGMGTRQDAVALGAPDAVLLPLNTYDPVRVLVFSCAVCVFSWTYQMYCEYVCGHATVPAWPWSTQVGDACWRDGPTPYLHLARTMACMESTTKRLRIADALTNCFRCACMATSVGLLVCVACQWYLGRLVLHLFSVPR